MKDALAKGAQVGSAECAVTQERCADAMTRAERTLAEVLAEVLRADRLSVDSHFFDQLGAYSLVMAKFCARVRKRGDLPSVTMKDIYRHPTIRSLAADRRMPVDILHGDRRQVASLPHSRAELGHHQGVSAQLIKEVAVDGQTIGAQNLRQDLGEGAFGARHRVGAALLSHRTFGGSDLSPLGKCVFHASSAHGPGRNEATTVCSPRWSARSVTSLPTARSSTPSPNGLNTQAVPEPFLAGLRPLRMSGRLQRMNFLCPTSCSARCTEVWARQT